LTTTFISDLHLCPSRPAATELFLSFLHGPATHADTLYILGDLFEYWSGDDHLDEPFNARVCRAIKTVSERGTPVLFLAGNRDFLVGDEFAAACGATLLTEPVVHEVGGVRALLIHGDTLCTDDVDYQNFRATVRTPHWRADFLSRPLGERIATIEGLRERSTAEKQRKSMALMDTNADAVAAAFRKHGVTRMIHGHTHRLAQHEHLVDGTRCERWVLGDWSDTAGNCLTCDPSAWALRRWNGEALV
jgi:UDP-2,3-diacylglucosamine hydrolase